MTDTPTFTAFEGRGRLASGNLATIRAAVVAAERRGAGRILVFNDETGAQTDLDIRPVGHEGRGDGAPSPPVASEVADAEVSEAVPRRAGRPRLGVVGREVTLLPRHWDWLATQPGGASVVLRKLIDAARKSNEAKDIIRVRRESAYRFMSVMAGNLPGFEEASRALFAGDDNGLSRAAEPWPRDIREFAFGLLAGGGRIDVSQQP